MTRRNGRPRGWRGNSKLELAFVIVAALIIGYAVFGYHVANAVPKNTFQGRELGSWSVQFEKNQTGLECNQYIKCIGDYAQFPSIAANFNTTFTAEGSLSADNPIHIHLEITNANLTDWTHIYCNVTYTDGNQVADPTKQSVLKLENLTDGAVGADGWAQWSSAGASWVFLLPCIHIGEPDSLLVSTHTFIESGDPAINITGAADATAWQGQKTMTQIDLSILGLSIFGAYEVVKRATG